MTKQKQYYTLPELPALVGAEYGKVRYAAVFTRLVEPLTIGKYRLFTPDQVATLKQHFATKGAK